MAAQKPKIVFWKPGGVVRGRQVYLDANFLVAVAWPGHIWHNSAGGLLASLEERKTRLVLSSLALNEAIYQLTSLERKEGGPVLEEPRPASPRANSAPGRTVLRKLPGNWDQDEDIYWDEDESQPEDIDEVEQPDLEQALPGPPARSNWADRLEAALQAIRELAFFEPPDLEFHRMVIRGVRELNLDPTDAFHYAAARRLACPLVSNDAGFQKIPDQNLVIVTFF